MVCLLTSRITIGWFGLSAPGLSAQTAAQDTRRAFAPTFVDTIVPVPGFRARLGLKTQFPPIAWGQGPNIKGFAQESSIAVYGHGACQVNANLEKASSNQYVRTILN
jgi:hypothetical protein